MAPYKSYNFTYYDLAMIGLESFMVQSMIGLESYCEYDGRVLLTLFCMGGDPGMNISELKQIFWIFSKAVPLQFGVLCGL